MDLNIDRINELYKKAKSVGLTEEEKAEQAQLRADYVKAIRQNLRGTLERVSFVNPDGSISKASDMKKGLSDKKNK
ncbi:MAG: DUF896 domain-containing protein [Clostridiales bacterium]|jgi:uncharacterized protein YnzC (UPF0291/DUF896 family)|nr:DUF896 domain-containing protein [Clostridiales bacterium]